jgi:hypothetical protein
MPRAASARRKALKALLGKFQPLVLPGAYDAFSARLVERAGYPATYLGSFAAAASAFGLPDVGLLTLNELAEEASRIVDAVSIPVLADAENGFYDAPNLWRAIKVFEDAGVAGVHIEDNLGGKHTSAPAGLLSVEQIRRKSVLPSTREPTPTSSSSPVPTRRGWNTTSRPACAAWRPTPPPGRTWSSRQPSRLRNSPGCADV